MEQRRGRRSSRSRDMYEKIKPKSEPNTNPNIPQEIIAEILTRLPYDSLCRFRCVSKQWFSLISESKLVSRSKTHKVLVLSKLGDGSFSFHSIDQQCSVEKIQTPWEKNQQHREVDIYGSCHGLLLLGLGVDLYLWNPLNGYFKKVLSYHRLVPEYVTRGGLCFDSSTNGYKAVISFRPFYHSRNYLMIGNFRRKSWKEVRFPYKDSAMCPGPVVDGRLHWFARKSTGSLLVDHIFSFDPRLDKFKKLPMPKPPKDGDRVVLLGLGVLDDCLCMIRHDNQTYSKGNAEVWVMKEYGEKKSWNLMLVISSQTFTVWGKVVPLCCTKNGEVLAVQHLGSDAGYVTVFNSSGDLVWDLRNPSNCGYSVDAVAYEETSVKPAGYTWENEDQSGIATYVEHCLSSSPRKMVKGKGDGKWDYLDPEEEDAEETQKKRSLKTNRPS